MLKYKSSTVAEKAEEKEDDCIEIAWVFSNSRALQFKREQTQWGLEFSVSDKIQCAMN